MLKNIPLRPAKDPIISTHLVCMKIKYLFFITLSLFVIILISCSKENNHVKPSTEEDTVVINDTTSIDRAQLVKQLRAGGFVLVHRYTGTSMSNTPSALSSSIDDGQRMSSEGERNIKALGEVYKHFSIPVGQVLSSEYFFVHQHAVAAMGEPVTDHRDLTGSLYFRDSDELDRSLRGLRQRTTTVPPAGKNTVLFTHQGKFDKAFGIWLPPGQTVVFHPKGDSVPNIVANISLEDWINITL